MRHDDFVMPPEDGKELMVLFRHRCAARQYPVLEYIPRSGSCCMVLCLVYVVILAILRLFRGGFPRSGSRTPRRPARRARPKFLKCAS